MKKFYLYSLFFIAVINAYGQSPINLSFQGMDAELNTAVKLDSVYINNLTLNCDTTLYAPISKLTVNASWPVGINELKGKNANEFVLNQNFPNPFIRYTTVTVYRDYSGPLNLMLIDCFGKKLAEYHDEFEKGVNSFTISSSGNKVLILEVFDINNKQSIKLICNGQDQTSNAIQYDKYTDSSQRNMLKNAEISGFKMTLGNQLRYDAFSKGYFNQTITDNPKEDTEYLFKMSNNSNFNYWKTQSQNFETDISLASWLVPNTANIVNGELIITPTLGNELLSDPSLEADYTSGKCNSLVNYAGGGSFTYAQSADVNSGSKAQSLIPIANGNGVKYFGAIPSANKWYKGSVFVKRTSGAKGHLTFGIYQGTGTGIRHQKYLSDNAYTKVSISVRAIDNNQLTSNIFQTTYTTPYDQMLIDDFSMKLMTLSSMAIYKKLTKTSYRCAITPSYLYKGGIWRGSEPFGLWVSVDNPNDPKNGICIWHCNESYVYMDKYVNGVITNLIKLSYSANGGQSNTIEGVRDGNLYSLFYAGVQIGTTQTVSDIGTCEHVGIFSTSEESRFQLFDLGENTDITNVFAYGDSKTFADYGALQKLGGGIREYPTRVGIPGTSVAAQRNTIDAEMTAAVGTPKFIIVNLGTNDFTASSVSWKAHYQYIIDAMHIKWPNAIIGLAISWKKGFDNESAQRATDLLSVISGRLFASIAVDERITLKSNDDGATYLSSDNVHPNALGYYNTAKAWREWMNR